MNPKPANKRNESVSTIRFLALPFLLLISFVFLGQAQAQQNWGSLGGFASSGGSWGSSGGLASSGGSWGTYPARHHHTPVRNLLANIAEGIRNHHQNRHSHGSNGGWGSSGSLGSRIVASGSSGGWASSGTSIVPAGSTGSSLIGSANSSLLSSQVAKVDAAQLVGGVDSTKAGPKNLTLLARRGKSNSSLLIASLVDLDDRSPAARDDRRIVSSKDDSSLEKEVRIESLAHDQGHSEVAILTLEVPRDAKVFINGSPTTTRGTRRKYGARSLAKDKKHEYKIRVESAIGGEIVSTKTTIWLNHDEKRTVVLDFKPPTKRIAFR